MYSSDFLFFSFMQWWNFKSERCKVWKCWSLQHWLVCHYAVNSFYILTFKILVDKFSEIGDSLCVGQKINDDEERVILFLKMSNGYKFNEALVKKVKTAIRMELSARHVPALILEISDIPVRINCLQLVAYK